MDYDMNPVSAPGSSRPPGHDGSNSSSDGKPAQQGASGSPLQPQGSPQASVDETSLQKQKDKNVISLKVKLAQRRPVNQLIDQGIMPPPKTPSVFFEQRRHLERARTSDILKTKIEKRPDRQTLVEQHILEDTKIAPSLVERERKLKKAKLTDYLNEKIAHRPSPLELVQGNILKLPIFDEAAGNTIDGASLEFPNSEETARSTDNDTEYSTEEDGSSTASSPTGALANLKDLQLTSPASSACTSLSTPLSIDSRASSPANSVASSCPSQQQQQLFELRRRANSLIPTTDSSSSAVTPGGVSSSSNQGYPGFSGSSVASTGSGFSSAAVPPSAGGTTTTFHNGHRRSKKCRVKPPVPQKARTLKFHEYKAPPAMQNKNFVPAKTQPATTTSAASDGHLSDSKTSTTYERNVRENQRLMRLMEDQQRRMDSPQVESGQRDGRQAQQDQTSSKPVESSTQMTTQNVTLAFPSQTGLIQFQPIRVMQQTSQQMVSPASNPNVPPAPAMNIGCYPAQQMSINVPSPPEIPLSMPAAACPAVEEKAKKPARPEDMKVNDLKLELKKRNLPVSGSKTHLLERLRNYLQANPDDTFAASSPAPNSTNSSQEMKVDIGERSPATESGPSSAVTELDQQKTFEFQVAPAAAQTLSFMQLDPLQQQQAAAIAIQTLTSQMRSIQANAAAAAAQCSNNGKNRPVQGMQFNTIPSTPMDVDKTSQASNAPQQIRTSHAVTTLPTIFLATTQHPPGGTASLTFQSTPLQVPPNSVPCIITMNGLSSTLNLINGFNIVANPANNDPKQEPQFAAGPCEPEPTPNFTQNLAASTLTTLQQHLQQKILNQQIERDRSFSSPTTGEVAASTTTAAADPSLNMDVYQEPVRRDSYYQTNSYNVDQHGNGALDAMLTDEDTMLSMDQHDNGSVYKTEDNFAHCSYSPQSSSDCIRSEAIDDILEILIRNDEIPASAAQEALPKNLILQHTKPNQIIQHNPFQQATRLYTHITPHYQSAQSTSDEPMHSSNSQGPLPPISSISPANHGSPVSLTSNGEVSDTNLFQQQLSAYLLQTQLLQNMDMSSLQHDLQQQQQQQQHDQPMDYQCHGYGNQNNEMDSTSHSGDDWLNNWLQQGSAAAVSMPGTANDARPGDDQNNRNFKQEAMHIEAFQDAGNHMDQSEVVATDQNIFDFFDEFGLNSGGWMGAGEGGNGSFLAGPTTGTPMYWTTEAEQMM